MSLCVCVCVRRCAIIWSRCKCSFHFVSTSHLLVVLVDVAVGELFAAQFALVRLVLAVDDLVRRHLVEALERAAADLARVRTLLCNEPRKKNV